MQLNDVGFQFIQRGNYMTWADRVQMLRDFKEKNGNLKIPVSHPDLGWFVSSQREEWRKRQEGHSTSLTDERYTDLNELGFVWVAGKRKGPVTQPRKSWEERYQELLAFRQEYGHACVPQHYPLGGGTCGRRCVSVPSRLGLLPRNQCGAGGCVGAGVRHDGARVRTPRRVG